MAAASTNLPQKQGQGKGQPGRKRRFERAAKSDHPLTGKKLDVLQTIAESRFLSTPQVAGIMDMSEKAARDHLRDLFDLGLLDVLPVPQLALGGSPFTLAAKVHVATRKGIDALNQIGIILPLDVAKTAAQAVPQYSFLAHELAVRDTFVWLVRSTRANPDHVIERWSCAGDLRVLDRRVDALFVYALSPEANAPVVVGLIEADMATERGTSGGATDRWSEKFAGYAAVFAQDDRTALRTLTGGFTRARLVVTVPTKARAEWVARRAAGTGVESYLWVAVRQDMESADVHSPIWLRTSGSDAAFIPKSS